MGSYIKYYASGGKFLGQKKGLLPVSFHGQNVENFD